MNRHFRLVWNEASHCYVPAPEHTCGRGRRSSAVGSIAAAVAMLTGMVAHAADNTLPMGGKVTQGNAAISQSGGAMTVGQTSARAVINWNSFNVGADASVAFVQPSSSSVVLNRVVGGDASQILGRMSANGQVFLVNPNGVLFGAGAEVDVGGLVAATLAVSDTDFMAGRAKFAGSSTASVINAGNLQANDGGYVALLGARVGNTGTITAKLGTVAMAAGQAMTLDFAGDGLLSVAIDASAANALAANGGLVVADGGQVLLSAQAANALAATVVNNTGVIEARALTDQGGRIVLDGGSDGVTSAAGRLDASASQGQGGSVIVTGHEVLIASDTVLSARGALGGGEVLVGGGLHGGPAADGSSVRQAEAVTVDAGAVLDASATGVGNGGTVAVWSDIHDTASATRVYGSLLASGGPQGGNGGNIETSGHWLDIRGASGGAAAGTGGTAGIWLLDPYDVTITTAAGSGGSFTGGTWAPSASGSNVQNTAINALLNGGTSVVITTGTGGSDLGDITVNAPVTKSSGSTDVTFTLQAANSIVINSDITHTGGTGKLNLLFLADNDNGTHDGTGIVMLNANLSTGGGFVQFGNGATLSINGVTSQVGGDVYVGGNSAQTIATGGGNVTINGQTIIANPAGLTISAPGASVSFGGLLDSGDSYQLFNVSNIDFADAYTDAKGSTGGAAAVGDTYLATITSRLENAVASRAANYEGVWLGARRGVTTADPTTVATSDNNWRWIDGPEGAANGGTGLVFWTTGSNGQGGSSTNGGYANWNPGEPNNSPGNLQLGVNESALQFTGTQAKWNDLSPTSWQTGVNGYLQETNLAASPLTVNAGSGTVTFGGMVGGNKALASLNVSAGTVAINGGGVTTQGVQTYNGNVTLGASATTLTQTNADTDFTLLNGQSITNAYGGNASLTIATTGAIILGQGSSISSSNGALTTVLDADSDASGSGYIWLQGNGTTGATISTNGGAITLGGGTSASTGYAVGASSGNSNGVTLDTATLNSGGGNITVRGESSITAVGYSESEGSGGNTDGVRMYSGNTINAGSGTIVIDGIARGTSGSSNGIETNSQGYSKITSAATNTTAITLYGDATAGSSSNGWGTFLWGTNSAGILLAATGSGGGVSLDGHGRSGIADGGGTHLEPDVFVLASSGPISLTGTQGSNSSYEDVVINGTVGFASSLPSGFGTSPVTASSSDITITADSLSADRVFGNGSFTGSAVQSSGTLTIAPRTSGKALTVQSSAPGGSAFWINPSVLFGTSGLFKTGFTKLVFGSPTTGDVTLDNYSFDNDTAIETGANAVLGSVSIASHTLAVTVTGSGSITQTGTVAVAQLALDGANSAVTLNAADNAIGTLAANVGSLALNNGGALTIGTAGGMNGISASGTVAVDTRSGNLTLAQGVATGNTSTAAVLLNAGQTAAAGTATGGDIVVSGSPTITVGSGGRATLMTGSVAGSTGLTALVGSGSGRFRYDSDETATHYASALGSGLYAIYREQPTITVTAGNASKTYDKVAYSGGNGVTTAGYVNGDTSADLAGTLVYGGSAQGAVNAASYAITPGGYTTGLGYGFNYVSGALVINPLTVSLVGSTVYDGSTAVAGSALSVANLLTGDAVILTGSAAVGDKDVGTRALTSLGNLALTGGSAANYTLNRASGTATITPAPLTATIVAANKTYDATTAATTSGSLTGLFGGDSVSLAISGSFVDKNAGVGKTVNVSGSISGADAGNYTLTDNATTTATITPLALAALTTDVSKLADGTAFFGGNGVTFKGFVGGDTAADLSGTLVYGGTAQGARSPGTYSLLAGGLTSTNYLLQWVPGILTIGSALPELRDAIPRLALAYATNRNGPVRDVADVAAASTSGSASGFAACGATDTVMMSRADAKLLLCVSSQAAPGK